MLKSPIPQPLTRLNVTKHDRIWDKGPAEVNILGFDTKNVLFSPPLKHITPETAEELWENFDPLDLLIDSASEKTVKTESSSDTMIMMTSAEEKRNEERIKNSFKKFEHQKNVTFSQMKPLSEDYATQDFVVQQSDFSNNNKGPADEDFLNDEGYGTDSRTNTTASLSSPLSSSLSSLLTSESSSSQGSMQRTLNGNTRLQHIAGNGRLVVGNRQNVAAKKKIQPIEKQDNSLMEKLRALTTIQEEDASGFDANANANQNLPRNGERRSDNYGSDKGRFIENARFVNDPKAYNSETVNGFDPSANRYANDLSRQANDPRQSELRSSGMGQNPVNSSNYGKRGKQTYLSDDSNFFLEDPHTRDGIFRAVPVKIGQKSSSDIGGLSRSDNIPVNGIDGSRHAENSEKRDSDSRHWNGDVSSSDNRCRMSAHVDGVDSACPGEVTPKTLSKVSNYMYSMPNLAKDPRSVPQQDQVVMRRPKPNVRRADLRYSWDCSGLNQVHSKYELESQNLSNNIPVKNFEVPKLSNQFRASSEMSLQNGRPLFATSSDIYRLFQGQGHGNPGFSPGKQTSHRHSFHAMPSSHTNFSLPQNDPSMEDMRHRLRAASSTQGGTPGRIKNGPVRGNHELYNYNSNYSDGIPRQAGSQPRPRPNSVAETKEKLSTLV